ncbi:MAG: glycoside hydrolase family 3 protein, partial [Ktedonobacterales bacterium]
SYRSGVLWLSWAGVDPGHTLNVIPITLTGGLTAGQHQILGAFNSVTGPSLTLDPNGNRLLLAWSLLSPANRLQFAVSDTGTSWVAPLSVPIGETSGATPSLLGVASGGLPNDFLAWTGMDPGHSLNVQYTQQFPQWTTANSKSILPDTAFGAPALGHVGSSGNMILAWAGTDAAHHLSAATLTTLSLDQRIDNYIAGLSTAQRIGQTLMFAVYANSYNANLDQALTQWHIGSAIVYTRFNGGPVEPATLAGLQQLVQALQSHAQTPLLLAIDEEGGTVDRLAPYYGGTPSARQLAATGNPQNAYNQAQTDAGRMRSIGLNVDFAPVVDVDQGGGAGQSRMFGTTAGTVSTYAGAFLDGLQQHGVAGTLKHWPGIGASTGNPDFTLPTINKSQAQMNAVDFAPFRSLLSHQPGMIMVTTVMAPAFDAQNPAMLSPVLVNTVLRGQLGYQGVIVTDALDAQGLIQYMSQHGYPNAVQGLAEASVRAFLAGNDLIEAPIEQDRLAAVVAAMTQAVASGRISQARLQASVHRIIRLKVERGLMTLP